MSGDTLTESPGFLKSRMCGEVSGRLPSQGVSLDLSPCPDDRPFVLDLGTSPLSLFQSSPSLSGLLGGSILATLVLIAILAFAPRSEGTPRTDARGPILFLLLGIGFMIIEVPLIQKLVLPLGYPTLSLSVILFSLLLGGGAGAFASQRFEGERLRYYALFCAVGVASLSLLFAFSSDAVSRALLGLPIAPRCGVVALLLLPLGFLLGTPFPSGMRLLGGDSRGVALAWALNGTASVVGSIGAAVLAKLFGFSVVLAIGSLTYLCVAGVLGIGRIPARRLQTPDVTADNASADGIIASGVTADGITASGVTIDSINADTQSS